MGVRGLEFYISNCCPSASPTVSIPDLIARRLEGSDEIVIVVDGLSCIELLYGDLEWLEGGQIKQFGEKAKYFVQAFARLCIRLVFFFDGPTIEIKRRTWIGRRYESLNKVYEVLDAVTGGASSKEISKVHEYRWLHPKSHLARLILEHYCGCEVHQSVAECDEEIAEYARKHNVFAILGQDTDYIIMDLGSVLYLSAKYFNLNTMTTRLYDRFELAKSLKIQPAQLPLLATLMGNDIVSSQDLKGFHLSLTGQRFDRGVNLVLMVPKLAKFIQQHHNDGLSEIAGAALGDRSKAKDIQASLLSYDCSKGRDIEEEVPETSWARVLQEAKNSHKNNYFAAMLYAVMSGLPYESSTSFEDFRKNDLPTLASATKHIRQHIYGILLQEKPLESLDVHLIPERIMAGPGSLDKAKYMPAIPPKCEHPGLMKLWNDRSEEVSDIRWQLFIHSVSSRLDVKAVRALPSYSKPILELFKHIIEIDLRTLPTHFKQTKIGFDNFFEGQLKPV